MSDMDLQSVLDESEMADALKEMDASKVRHDIFFISSSLLLIQVLNEASEP